MRSSLDVNALKCLSKDDFWVLTAIEMAMRNHEIVPSELTQRHGNIYKVLKNWLKHKLLHDETSTYDGFRLTYLGYDFPALKALVNHGVLNAVCRQLGPEYYLRCYNACIMTAKKTNTGFCRKAARRGNGESEDDDSEGEAYILRFSDRDAATDGDPRECNIS